MLTEPPKELLQDANFVRYLNAWRRNEASIVFVPLSEICRQGGFLDQAYEICQAGLLWNPRSVSGRLSLARIYCDRGESEKARPLLQEILADFPGQKDAEALLNTFEKIPGPEGPRSLWETCTMAQILAEQGDTKMALKIVEGILKKESANKRALELQKTLKERV